jgi:hypothetical protein
MALTIRNTDKLRPFLDEYKKISGEVTDAGAITAMVCTYKEFLVGFEKMKIQAEKYKDQLHELQQVHSHFGLALRTFFNSELQPDLFEYDDDDSEDNEGYEFDG